MKRFMTFVLAAAAIFTLSEVAQASHPGGRGNAGGRNGVGHGPIIVSHDPVRSPTHEYGWGSHFWSRSYFAREFGYYLYWSEEYRWWYRYNEGGHKYEPLSQEYRPVP